jgi:hypothetical protein
LFERSPTFEKAEATPATTAQEIDLGIVQLRRMGHMRVNLTTCRPTNNSPRVSELLAAVALDFVGHAPSISRSHRRFIATTTSAA